MHGMMSMTLMTWIKLSSSSSENLVTVNGEDSMGTDDELRKMLTDMFIDNKTLRKQVNTVIHCAL